MCSVPLDLFSMLELGGQQPSSAMISMNQLTTGHHLANRRAARKKTTGIPNPKRMFEEVNIELQHQQHRGVAVAKIIGSIEWFTFKYDFIMLHNSRDASNYLVKIAKLEAKE